MSAEPRMTFCRKTFLAGACLAILACGSSEPDSPLILGGEARAADVGPRRLTDAQSRALQGVITSTGEACAQLDETYLRDAGAAGESESWDVRCRDGAYRVVIHADGMPADVHRCLGRFGVNDPECVPGYRRSLRDREPEGSPALNPELGKLLEPMTAKDPKVD